MYVEDQIRQSLLNGLVKWAGNLEFMLQCGGGIEIGARVDVDKPVRWLLQHSKWVDDAAFKVLSTEAGNKEMT